MEVFTSPILSSIVAVSSEMCAYVSTADNYTLYTKNDSLKLSNSNPKKVYFLWILTLKNVLFTLLKIKTEFFLS